MREESRNPDRLLSETEAADLLGIGRANLARHRRVGPPLVPYIRLGGRIKYRRADIDSTIERLLVSDDFDGERRAAVDEAQTALDFERQPAADELAATSPGDL